ncbi:DUF1292 domain-containing protein [Paenibacillus darwinianus]|nr:DUF1292 domain-containing protein [Paenibacillus darwinianus]
MEGRGIPRTLGRLREAYGIDVELLSDDGETELFRILAEYRLNDSVYAALQSAAMRKEDEVAFFRVLEQDDGRLELESIEDEDEWETAAEGYDELLFESGGDR